MPDLDLVIRGGTVVDGSGGKPFEADVAIAGGKIVEVGKVAIEDLKAAGGATTDPALKATLGQLVQKIQKK